MVVSVSVSAFVFVSFVVVSVFVSFVAVIREAEAGDSSGREIVFSKQAFHPWGSRHSTSRHRVERFPNLPCKRAN